MKVFMTETFENTLIRNFAHRVVDIPGVGNNFTGYGSEIEAQSDYRLLERMEHYKVAKYYFNT